MIHKTVRICLLRAGSTRIRPTDLLAAVEITGTMQLLRASVPRLAWAPTMAAAARLEMVTSTTMQSKFANLSVQNSTCHVRWFAGEPNITKEANCYIVSRNESQYFLRR